MAGPHTSVARASAVSAAALPRRQQLSCAAIFRKCSTFCPRLAIRTSAARPNHISRLQAVRVVAFRETEKIQDWRVKQMVELAHTYLVDFLTHKQAGLADQIFDEEVVHKDMVWDPSHPTVGIQGMKHFQEDLATAFPDFYITVDQYAVVDTHDGGAIMVTYSGSATNLGSYHNHKPSHHASNFEGVNMFRFNHDRSRIKEIHVYRSAFAEDLNEMGERVVAQEGGFRELRLKRLV